MTTFDKVLNQLIDQVNKLPLMAKAAFFAAASEALFPLYEDFAKKKEWGDPRLLREAIDGVALYVAGAQDRPDLNMLLAVERLVPHGDDFDAPMSTYAQDAVICVDVALRLILGDKNASVSALEFALEPVRTVIAIEQLGCLDPGSSLEAQSWWDRLPDEPRMAKAIKFLESLVIQLTEEVITPSFVRTVGVQGRSFLATGS